MFNRKEVHSDQDDVAGAHLALGMPCLGTYFYLNIKEHNFELNVILQLGQHVVGGGMVRTDYSVYHTQHIVLILTFH